MILPRYRKDWPADWLELFEERAAIMEFCANFPRDYAEKKADENIRQIALREKQ